MNLLVHMDARGTPSVYPHLGINTTYFMARWSAFASRTTRVTWMIHVTTANPGKSDAGKPAPVVRRSGEKVIIAPHSSDAWSPARAHRWKRMLEG